MFNRCFSIYTAYQHICLQKFPLNQNFVHEFDIICLSKTYLNSEIPSVDKISEATGYKLFREDHPSNSKCSGVYFYYKSSLPFRVINVKYLQESNSFELRTGVKCCKFSCLYRSSSQTQDEFEFFLKNFELTLDKIRENNLFIAVVLDDFNANSNNWCKADITSLEGSMIGTIASSYGLNQIIQEPIHVLNSSSSCQGIWNLFIVAFKLSPSDSFCKI